MPQYYPPQMPLLLWDPNPYLTGLHGSLYMGPPANPHPNASLIGSSVLAPLMVNVSHRHGTGSLGHRVNGSFGSTFTSGSPGYHFDPVWDPKFSVSEKMPKMQNVHLKYGTEMTKVNVRCLLLDWNHWMSVHAMNFYFYLWLLKILLPESTSSHISRHLELYIIEQGHRVNWISGSLYSRVTGSQNVTQFHLWSLKLRYMLSNNPHLMHRITMPPICTYKKCRVLYATADIGNLVNHTHSICSVCFSYSFYFRLPECLEFFHSFWCCV